MAAEGAFGRPRQPVASGEIIEGLADLRPLCHCDRQAKRIRQLCPENRADTLEAEADLGGHRADQQRRAGDQIVEAGVRRNWHKLVESFWPKRRVVDRFDERDFAYLLFVECDDRRLQLAFKIVDFPPCEHYRPTIVRYPPVETHRSARGDRDSRFLPSVSLRAVALPCGRISAAESPTDRGLPTKVINSRSAAGTDHRRQRAGLPGRSSHRGVTTLEAFLLCELVC